MSELTITLMRLGLLALLWAFVFAVASVLRGDLYGTRLIARRSSARATGTAAAASSAAPRLSRAEAKAANKAARANATLPTHLMVTEGPLAGTTLPLRESGTLIGRNPECALILDDDYASGRHLRIYRDAQGWVAEDLGSTNGTFLGSAKLEAPAPVQVGSVLRIGKTVVELRR